MDYQKYYKKNLFKYYKIENEYVPIIRVTTMISLLKIFTAYATKLSLVVHQNCQSSCNGNSDVDS